MKLWRYLPLAFRSLSLPWACAGLPARTTHRQLTPLDFNSSISSGISFIEFLSPYSGHCRAFAPTWDELVQKYENTDIMLAQVNCVYHGDLCNSNNVKGYPQMNIYKDGEFVETFKGPRSLSRVTEFLGRHSSPSATIPEVEQAQELSPGFNPNPNGTVLMLDDANFESTLAQGPTFVNFGAPWCGNCKKLEPTWKDLARSLQYKLTIAQVDCTAHPFLCKSQAITGYATLMYFSNGTETEYTGGREFEQLLEYVEYVRTPGVKSISADESEEHVSKENQVYVLLYPSSESKLLSALKPLLAPKNGSPTIYTIAGSAQWLTPYSSGVWILVVLEGPHNPVPLYTVPGPISESSQEFLRIKSWLKYIRHEQSVPDSAVNEPTPMLIIEPAPESLLERTGRYLDTSLKYIELYVINNPVHLGICILAALVLVTLGAKKLVARNINLRDGNSKSTDKQDSLH